MGVFSFLNLSPGRGEVSKMSAVSLAYCGTYVYTSHNLNDPFEQIFQVPLMYAEIRTFKLLLA